MKRWGIACLAAAVVLASVTARAGESTRTFGPFGKVWLYQKNERPKHVVLFVSGDGGWNLGVVDMARDLARLDSLVVGIDINTYFRHLSRVKAACVYPASDFEALSQYIQKAEGFPHYITPVLVGYSSGATLIYAILAEAPATTFRGGISLGFCPDLPLKKRLCRGRELGWERRKHGGWVLPAPHLETPWVAFQGLEDQVCDPAGTETFVKAVPGGQIVILPKVGHGYSVPRNWLPQFRKAFSQLTAAAPAPTPVDAAVNDLPLVEVPSEGPATPYLAVFLSGDGGWATIDKHVSRLLAARGIPVVGLNSLKYFWTPRTPAGAAADLTRIIDRYLTLWHRQRIVLVGYSFGADALPFLVNRLPARLAKRVTVVGMLAPSRTAQFEFHLSEWLGKDAKDSYPVQPEVEKIRGPRIVAICGDEEKGTDNLCRALDPHRYAVLEFKGAHHLGGNYQALADAITTAIHEKICRINGLAS